MRLWNLKDNLKLVSFRLSPMQPALIAQNILLCNWVENEVIYQIFQFIMKNLKPKLQLQVSRSNYNIRMDFVSQKKKLEPLLKDPKNHLCADCNAVSPTWVSLDFGVFLCSNCSGAHRGLGPTITRVRSANLDLWEQEWYRNMVIGNEKLNAYWQSNPLHLNKKPKSDSSSMQVGRYVYEKYIKKKYVKNLGQPDPLTIYKANNYSFQAQQVKQGRQIIQKVKTEAICVQKTKNEKVSAKGAVNVSVKKIENLIDFEQEVKQAKPQHCNLLIAANQLQPTQLQIPPTSNQNNSARLSQIGTSFTTQNSKEDFISFDQLLKAQKPAQNALHHSLSSQQINKANPNLANLYYHPYNPSLGQHNLVYSSYYQLNPTSNQHNYPHSHSPQPQTTHFPPQYSHQNFIKSNQTTNLPQNTNVFSWT